MSSIRFEDRGLTLRLFRNAPEAKWFLDTVSVAAYGPGFISKNTHGQWLDSDGVLPLGWTPNSELLEVPGQHGYYVDCDGRALCADVPPKGCHFHFVDEITHKGVWIVKDLDFEVLEQYVLWPSLEAISDFGVDIHWQRQKEC